MAVAPTIPTVEEQLIERTILHYLCFSDDKLIDDALKSAGITGDSDKNAYKEQIKKNNEAHVVAALNQKKDGKYVIDNLANDKINKLIDEKIVGAAVAKRGQNGGKSKTKKVRKEMIGGEVTAEVLKKIHQYIVKNCNTNGKIPIGSVFNINNATANFKTSASQGYDSYEVKTIELTNPQKAAAVAAAAYYYTQKKALTMVPDKINNEFFEIVKVKDINKFTDIKNFKLTDFDNNKDFFLFNYNNEQYMYDNDDPKVIKLSEVKEEKKYTPIEINTNNANNSYNIDDVDKIVRHITEHLGKNTDKKTDYEVSPLKVYTHFDYKDGSMVPPPQSTTLADDYNPDNKYDFTNCGVYQALGDGNCLIHSFLFLSQEYRRINMWRSGTSPYHRQIAVLFRKWLSKNLPKEIFDKVRSEVWANGEFTSFDTYKAYLYTDGMSNNNPLSTNDASILANLFNVHIDILFGNTTAPHLQRISCGDDFPDNIVIMNQYGGHFDIVLCEDKNASNADKYRPIIRPPIPLPKSVGGTRRRIGKKQNKTYRK